MIKYRCTEGAGTEGQCYTEATVKVKGRWLCAKHSHITQPPYKPPKEPKPWPRANKNDPEEWRAYHRQYRREYRRVHPRKKNGFSWPIEITILSNPYDLNIISLWKMGVNSVEFGKMYYHCEICCSQVEVTRKKSKPPLKGWRTAFCGHLYYRGEYFRTYAQHNCRRYPSSDLTNKCDRCGILSGRKAINHNRHPRGDYCFDLCLPCWRIMRPLFEFEHEYNNVINALKELRSEMRKSGMTVQGRAPNHYSVLDSTKCTGKWHKKFSYY
jgi:hypothetical protein